MAAGRGSPRHPDTRGCQRGPVAGCWAAEAPGGARGRGSGRASCPPSAGQSSPRGESGSPQLADGAHLLLQEVAELGPSAQVQKGAVEGHGRPPGGAPGGCGGYWLGSGGLPRVLEDGAPPRLCIFRERKAPSRASAWPAGERPTPLEPPPAGAAEARREVGAGGPHLQVDQAALEASPSGLGEVGE